jgi:2-oxoglutarate ferredoxin oxidoreductase subunit alpha
MSPSSSILSYLAEWSPKTGMMVKQAEDEITAVQLNIGSSYAGTRAMTATSGGGFDLMTESVSLSAMIEVPLVIVDVQRPGPATGLPTWTAQADLDLLKHSGHGEYSRVVMSASSARDAHNVVQEAFNVAEKWQIPVLVMSEKFIADSIQVVPKDIYKQISVERYLEDPKSDLLSEMRYGLSKNGVSPRWIPASNDVQYFANGDEHFIDGRLTEEAKKSELMIDKRARKMDYIIDELPAPVKYGSENPDVYVVGFGSTEMVMKDVVKEMAGDGVEVSYINFTYLYPLKTETLIDVFQSGKKVLLLEGNRSGQFGKAIEAELKRDIFANKFLKYDGRPFYRREVVKFIESNLDKNE